MTDSHRAALAPDALFAIACPTCFGHVAAPAGMSGRAACCPLCASTFEVPEPLLPTAPPPPVAPREVAAEPAAAPPPTPQPPQQTAAAPPASTAPAVVAAPEPDSAPAAESPPPSEPAANPEPAALAPAATPVAEPAAADDPAPAEAPSPEVAGELWPTPAIASEAIPDPAAGPVDTGSFQFREPVKVVGSGPTAIQLRRLTDEERRIRRGRRNMIFLAVGAALLIVLTLLLGNPGKKR